MIDAPARHPQHILVIGGYGLIGAEICRALLANGHAVTGLGRAPSFGQRLLPDANWIGADLCELIQAEAWTAHLEGIDVVVNAAGALQTGLKDDLDASQHKAITALIAACEKAGVKRFIQISAPGAEPDATTKFMATKGKADTALRASSLDWTIFKPGLVIAPTAYGATTLLRMLAAIPWVQPIVLADARIQTVAVSDVAEAVVFALQAPQTLKAGFDLVEADAHRLADVTASYRAWLGFPPAKTVIVLPRWLGALVGRVADLTGWLGWRSPLRTNALTVLADDVVADPAAWKAITGKSLNSLHNTLGRRPATAQERVFSRTSLVFPVAAATFALFWLASGLIGLWQLETAAAVVSDSLGPGLAKTAVIVGACADIAVCAGLAFRRTFRSACVAAILVSLTYLGLGTHLTPDLWADPLGPLVKVFPVMATAALLWAIAEPR